MSGYASQSDYMDRVRPDARARAETVEAELLAAFANVVLRREAAVVDFTKLTTDELARAILDHPLILKPLLASANLAGRALVRDLGIDIDTYAPRLSQADAAHMAAYLRQFLPDQLEVAALRHVDLVLFIDKEVRKYKGNWEKAVTAAINAYSTKPFKKRKFVAGEDAFELDCAIPPKGDVEVGIDVKRIESPRDIHKRADEIVNKASKLARMFPDAKFGAVVYYPFEAEQSQLQRRLESPHIDSVVFASEDEESIRTAAQTLLVALDVPMKTTAEPSQNAG